MDNQTEELWIANIQSTDTGTGLFVFPRSRKNDFGSTDWSLPVDSKVHGLLTKGLVKDTPYTECVQRGTQDWILAFKWIPEHIASFTQVTAAASTCGNLLCVKRCAGYGCACITGECK